MEKILATREARRILGGTEVSIAYCTSLLKESVRSITNDCTGAGIIRDCAKVNDWTEEQAAYYWMTEHLDGLLSIIYVAELLMERVRDDLEMLPAADEISEGQAVSIAATSR